MQPSQSIFSKRISRLSWPRAIITWQHKRHCHKLISQSNNCRNCHGGTCINDMYPLPRHQWWKCTKLHHGSYHAWGSGGLWGLLQTFGIWHLRFWVLNVAWISRRFRCDIGNGTVERVNFASSGCVVFWRENGFLLTIWVCWRVRTCITQHTSKHVTRHE